MGWDQFTLQAAAVAGSGRHIVWIDSRGDLVLFLFGYFLRRDICWQIAACGNCNPLHSKSLDFDPG